MMSKSQRPVEKPPDDLLDLRLEEYKSLRAEVLERIREANTLIITTAGGIGGAYAVLVSTFAREPALSISHAGGLVISCFLLIVWTPVAFAALAAIKSRDIWQIVLEISDHVSEIEELLYGNSPSISGWEHKRRESRLKRKRLWEKLSSPPYISIYKTMIFTCLGIALLATGYVIKVRIL